jgi:hypothetical protein
MLLVLGPGGRRRKWPPPCPAGEAGQDDDAGAGAAAACRRPPSQLGHAVASISSAVRTLSRPAVGAGEVVLAADARPSWLHDARHTCGTILGELHVDMHVIQRILGHAQISTTRIYEELVAAR